MILGRILRAATLIGVVFTTQNAFGTAGLSVDSHRARLARMSIDQRDALLQKLDQFESLPPDEQKAIRNLDAKIDESSPETRLRYLSLLRRFRAFRETLTDAEREALDRETEPAGKLAMITRLWEQKKAEALARPMPYDNAYQISELSRVRLRPMAQELVVWFSLDPKQDAREKAELARIQDPSKRHAFARSLAREKGLMAKVRDEDEEFREAERDVLQTLPRPVAEKLLTEQVKAEAVRRQIIRGGGGQGAAKEGNPPENNRRRAIQKLDEIQVFRNLDGETVSATNLQRFEKALPDWAHESLDPLPPDAARRRLRILYRLVFPSGTEIPEPPPEERPKPSAPRPRPRGNGSRVF